MSKVVYYTGYPCIYGVDWLLELTDWAPNERYYVWKCGGWLLIGSIVSANAHELALRTFL